MKFKKQLALGLVLLGAFVSTGCASITNTPTHSVRIQSTPANVAFSVVDDEGETVAKGTTPDTVVLRNSTKPFRAARYHINFDATDYSPQTKRLNANLTPWYFANFLFGYHGFLGMILFDPFTGTMYRLPDEASVVLKSSSNADDQSSLGADVQLKLQQGSSAESFK